MQDIRHELMDAMQRACRAVAGERAAQEPVRLALEQVRLERPKSQDHGDYACNAAMVLARALARPPRELAKSLQDTVLTDPLAQPYVARLDIAGPGFLNITLHAGASASVVKRILQSGASYGCRVPANSSFESERVLVEFVSANPTGPLHVGHGRQGALGDAICALLQTQGLQVEREFYYNDAGVQIQNLALSVQARARGLSPDDAAWPQQAYNGEYIADIARAYLAGDTAHASDGQAVRGTGNVEDLDAIRRFAVAFLRHEQDLDLQAFGVRFDRYFLESSLYTSGAVADTVQGLRESGHVYEQDGALWLRTTDFGDDKDRVMRKSDGSYTYFVPDVAYHLNKWRRGYHRAINIQGSDHFGTVARVRAGVRALEPQASPDFPQYVLHKMVRVLRGGQEVKISKRAGSYVTLRDLIAWSGEREEGEPDLTRGRDAVRFFLLSRKADTEFTFDIDLALSQTEANPVFYVQYAHARICSIMRQWGGTLTSLLQADLTPLNEPPVLALLRHLEDYPATLQTAAQELAPHDLTFYLRELAARLHTFYNQLRVLTDDETVKQARLALLAACATVLKNGLAVLGVSAPETM